MNTSLFLLSLIFLTFSLKQSLADAETDAVIDISGDNVRTGLKYYILPVFRGRGGGLTMGQPRNGSCPLDVVQADQEVSSGMSVTFSLATGKRGVIRVSTDLNFKFDGASICVQSTVWKLRAYDEEVGQYFVSTSGVAGNPGKETISNWFKIEKFDDDYKITFCPTVCDICKVICRDVGVYVDDGGKRRLALSDVPFKVMLRKV